MSRPISFTNRVVKPIEIHTAVVLPTRPIRRLARHSDINLTMNSYTMLDVYDQKAAVESLPPIPKRDHRQVSERIRATGTDGVPVATISAQSVVPTVVPRSAKTGAIRLASQTSESVPDRTDKRAKGARSKATKDAKTPEENGNSGIVLHQTALDDTNTGGGTRTKRDSKQKTALLEKGAAKSGAVGARNGPIDPGLEFIIEVWSTLSEASKAKVITIVKADEKSP